MRDGSLRCVIDRRLHDGMTDGYALALRLEAECARLQRRLADLAGSSMSRPAGELRETAIRLSTTQRELTDLRSLLADLRVRADPGGRLL